PYWTGQQVLSAAVRGGFISAELKYWPYQVPVHGLRDCGSFIMAIEQKDGLVMHPGRIRGQAAPCKVTRLKVAEGREFRSA
ncbi:MAG: hypothetical protein RL495_1138, partial [Verrucomicrobiota bacterium]